MSIHLNDALNIYRPRNYLGNNLILCGLLCIINYQKLCWIKFEIVWQLPHKLRQLINNHTDESAFIGRMH